MDSFQNKDAYNEALFNKLLNGKEEEKPVQENLNTGKKRGGRGPKCV